MVDNNVSHAGLRIGWAEVDITPQKLPVYIAGQFSARISEGVKDPLKATVLVLETETGQVIFGGIDSIYVPAALRDAVRDKLQVRCPKINGQALILNATHTHTGPFLRDTPNDSYQLWGEENDDLSLDVVPAREYFAFLVERLTTAIAEAWEKRAPGGVAYGQDEAVIARNRRWVNRDGAASMYGLNEQTRDGIDHIEGYEDHSVNVLAAYDTAGALTGLMVNVACPSQEDESLFELSADFWHEARNELRARHGQHVFVLPQCSAAGDLSPHLIFGTAAHERMLKLRGRTTREEIAARIADAVGRVLPAIDTAIEYAPGLEHRVQTLALPLCEIPEAEVAKTQAEIADLEGQLDEEKRRLREMPGVRQEPRWYCSYTHLLNHIGWLRGVLDRQALQAQGGTVPAEVHAVRLGEVAFATNPFELFLDFGVRMKVRSPAVQTFLIQLASGDGSYLPSRRAAAGGAYSAVPASCPVGPEGGDILVEHTLRELDALWAG